MDDRQNQERRFHFRGRARAGRRVELEYQHVADGDNGVGSVPSEDALEISSAATQATRAITSNIGVGGAFVLTESPLPVGSRLVVRIEVPTARRVIETDATVRWVVPVESADEIHHAGMGIKFQRLDVDALLLLSEYFASLTSSDSSDDVEFGTNFGLSDDPLDDPLDDPRDDLRNDRGELPSNPGGDAE